MYSANERPLCRPITPGFSKSSGVTVSSLPPRRSRDGCATRYETYTSTRSESCATAWSRDRSRNKSSPGRWSSSESATGCFQFQRNYG